MNRSTEQGSATIYQFPVGGRSRAGIKSSDTNAAVAVSAPRISFGGSWYHEEAVQEAQASRKLPYRFPTR